MDIGNKIRKLRFRASLTQEQLADRLGISFSTVRTHINHMLDKTGFETRTELAIHARLSGVVIPDM